MGWDVGRASCEIYRVCLTRRAYTEGTKFLSDTYHSVNHLIMPSLAYFGNITRFIMW